MAQQLTLSKAAQTRVKSGSMGWGRASGAFTDRVWWQILPLQMHAHMSGFLAAFSGLVWRRHVELAERERRTELAGRQAGAHHPSPQEIKVNNQDLTSCSRNLIMLWSESLWQCVCERRCVCIYRIRVSVLCHNPNPLSHLRICVIAAQHKLRD